MTSQALELELLKKRSDEYSSNISGIWISELRKAANGMTPVVFNRYREQHLHKVNR